MSTSEKKDYISIGKILAIKGPVIDIDFTPPPAGNENDPDANGTVVKEVRRSSIDDREKYDIIPSIYDALYIPRKATKKENIDYNNRFVDNW